MIANLLQAIPKAHNNSKLVAGDHKIGTVPFRNCAKLLSLSYVFISKSDAFFAETLVDGKVA